MNCAYLNDYVFLNFNYTQKWPSDQGSTHQKWSVLGRSGARTNRRVDSCLEPLFTLKILSHSLGPNYGNPRVTFR